MAPPPLRRMCGATCLIARNAAFTLIAITRSHSASVISSSGLTRTTPALLNRMSILPQRATVSSTMLNVGFLRNIHTCKDCLASLGGNLRRCLLAALRVDVRNHNTGAFIGKRDCAGAANAARRSGHNRNFLFELHSLQSTISFTAVEGRNQ